MQAIWYRQISALPGGLLGTAHFVGKSDRHLCCNGVFWPCSCVQASLAMSTRTCCNQLKQASKCRRKLSPQLCK